jgi:hypothetical protein
LKGPHSCSILTDLAFLKEKKEEEKQSPSPELSQPKFEAYLERQFTAPMQLSRSDKESGGSICRRELGVIKSSSGLWFVLSQYR